MDSDQELEDYISSLNKKLHLPNKQLHNRGKKEVQDNNTKISPSSFLKKSATYSIQTDDLGGQLIYTAKKKELSDVLQRANDLMTKYGVGKKMQNNSALATKNQSASKFGKENTIDNQKKNIANYGKTLETIPLSEGDISISSESNFQELGGPVNEINSAKEDKDLTDSNSDSEKPFSLLKRGSIQWFNDDEVIEEVLLDDLKVTESKTNADNNDKEDSSSSEFYGQQVQLNITDLSSNDSQDMTNKKIKENSAHKLNEVQPDNANVGNFSCKKEIAVEKSDDDVKENVTNSSESIAEDFDIMSKSTAEDRSVNSSEHSLRTSSKMESEIDDLVVNTSSASANVKEGLKEHLSRNKVTVLGDYSSSSNNSSLLKAEKPLSKGYKKYRKHKTEISHLKHRYVSHSRKEKEGKAKPEIQEAMGNSSFHGLFVGPTSSHILNTLVVMQEAKALSDYQPGLVALKNMLHMEMDRHEQWHQRMKELFTSVSKYLSADYSYTTWEETKQILSEGRKKIRKRTPR